MTYRSRKFILSGAALIWSGYGLSQNWLDGGTWVAALSLILGLYGAANIMEKKQ